MLTDRHLGGQTGASHIQVCEHRLVFVYERKRDEGEMPCGGICSRMPLKLEGGLKYETQALYSCCNAGSGFSMTQT